MSEKNELDLLVEAAVAVFNDVSVDNRLELRGVLNDLPEEAWTIPWPTRIRLGYVFGFLGWLLEERGGRDTVLARKILLNLERITESDPDQALGERGTRDYLLTMAQQLFWGLFDGGPRPDAGDHRPTFRLIAKILAE